MLAVSLFSIQAMPAFAAESRGWPWWCLALLAMAAVVVLALAFTLERGSRGRKARLAISNLGNAASRYEVRAEGPAGELRFSFQVDGKPLPQQEYAETVAAPQSVAHPVRPARQPSASASAPAAAASGLLGAGGAIADLLYSLSMILPGSLSRSVSGAAGSIRRAQSTGNRALQLPGQAARLTQVGAGAVSGVAPAGSSAPVGEATLQTVRRAWAQTPAVRPGETLVLQAEFWSGRGADPAHREVAILSCSLEQAGAVPLVTTGLVPVTTAPPARRLAARTIVVVTLLAGVAFAAWFVRSGIPVVW